MASRIILSLGKAIPKGLIFPFALGMNTLLAGRNLYFPRLKSSVAFKNHLAVIPSRVSLSDPWTILPGLDLIRSYEVISTSVSVMT